MAGKLLLVFASIWRHCCMSAPGSWVLHLMAAAVAVASFTRSTLSDSFEMDSTTLDKSSMSFLNEVHVDAASQNDCLRAAVSLRISAAASRNFALLWPAGATTTLNASNFSVNYSVPHGGPLARNNLQKLTGPNLAVTLVCSFGLGEVSDRYFDDDSDH